MDEDGELLHRDAKVGAGVDEPLELPERDCPECDGTCYDDDGAPCPECWGEGVVQGYQAILRNL
jgi:DnaJ-class molecular chaperone